MYIQTQDKTCLINSEFVSQFYVAPALGAPQEITEDTPFRLMAAADEAITLGTFATKDDAIEVLEFVARGLVDETASDKIIAIPDEADLQEAECECSNEALCDALRGLLEQLEGGGIQSAPRY